VVWCPATNTPPSGTLLAARRQLVQRHMCALKWLGARKVIRANWTGEVGQ